MRSIITLLCFALLSLQAYTQSVVGMTYIGSKTKAQIISMFGYPSFVCGASYFKMTYTSVDAKGQPDTLSGLLAVPDISNATFPIVMYEHGTSGCKTCVPSRYEQPGGDEGQVGLLFAGMGYVSLLPDYVGMGDGRGFQTYVHAATIISATEDMLDAFNAWAPQHDINVNNQLFITGYSQGGYASMAFHQYMETTYGAGTVTAATHNSGPYSLSGVMRDMIIADSVYEYPAYIPNTILGMNEVYGLYTNLNAVFKAPYVSDIQQYYDGNIDLYTLNGRILDSLVAENGVAIAHYMLQDSIFNNLQNDPTYILNQILKDNDVYKWAPSSPTRIFYCKADDQVPYKNSIVAIDTMYALGADTNLVKAVNLNSTFDHGQCSTPAFLNTILFFENYKDITLGYASNTVSKWKIYPNPAKDVLYIDGSIKDNLHVALFDLNGRTVLQTKLKENSHSIGLSSLKNGIYFLRIDNENDDPFYLKVVINR